MGHQIDYATFSEKTKESDMLKEINHLSYLRGEYHSKNDNSCIRFYRNDICLSYEEATEYLWKNDRGWYDCLAVRYYYFEDNITNKTIEELKRKCGELYKKECELIRANYFKSVKSEFVSCKYCNSKLARTFMEKKSNWCPVCGKDVRPKTTLDKIERMKIKREELDKKIAVEVEKEKKKQLKKAKVEWLVKFEYHI